MTDEQHAAFRKACLAISNLPYSGQKEVVQALASDFQIRFSPPDPKPDAMDDLRETLAKVRANVDALIHQGNVHSASLADIKEAVGLLRVKETPNELAAELCRIRIGDYLRTWDYGRYQLATTPIDTHADLLKAIDAIERDRFKSSVVRYGPSGTIIIAGNHKA